MRNRIFAILIVILLNALAVSAQVDRHEVRQGNRKFRKEDYREAELSYRKALVKDSLSTAARYNLASALYRQEDFEGAREAISPVSGEEAPAEAYYNAGDIALQLKDYAGAVDSFRQYLLRNPGDIDAKENYVYAKKMLENSQNQQNQQGGGQNDNKKDDDQKDDSSNRNPSGQQPQDQPQPDGNDGNDGNQGGEQSISPQQAQQMLNAVQAREQQTMEKVDREKAALLKSRQKEKNW